ncbi:MAG TPA: DUF6311 domain-containing protein [Devosia sp.]|nr:DUF6311 domain-containing protein [Devosia sp.]
MPDRLRDLLGGLAAMALGIAAFFVFAGWWVLIPTNIAFLDVGDRAMHTLGWMFFRDAPWGTPPGASPRLGIELANSIALVDGLPLFAIPFKLLSPWLPRPFQYWGYWWLLSFTLQALFGYLVARQMGGRRLVALLAAGFVVITPAFLFRTTLHMALSGHWTILAAMYLYARRTPPRLYAWPLLAGLTASIHAYLLAMVLGLWLAAWVQRLWTRRIGWRHAILEPVLIALVAVLVLWLVGFFYTGSLGSYGFGSYRLNLFWPFLTYRDWSQLVPDLPHAKYDYEGLSFLGIGILAILVLSIFSGAVAKLRVLVTARWLPLLLMALLLMVCALSNHIGVLGIELPAIPIGDRLEALGGIFRSSGRFVWPILYLVTIGAVVLLGRRFSPAWAVLVMTACLAAQIVDSQPGWSQFRTYAPPPSAQWSTDLKSGFWQRAADAGYTAVRAIPAAYKGLDWRQLEYYAVLHHMAVDSVYLGRVDQAALDALNASDDQAMDTGNFEPRTIYVLDADAADRIKDHATSDDLLAVVDNRYVFVPGGARLAAGLDDVTPLPLLGD